MDKSCDTTVVWGGALVVLLARIQRVPYKVAHIKHDVNDFIKRIGVYYMCIDDLPL